METSASGSLAGTPVWRTEQNPCYWMKRPSPRFGMVSLPAIPHGNGYHSVPPASIVDLFQRNLPRRGEAVALRAAALIDGRELLPERASECPKLIRTSRGIVHCQQDLVLIGH